LNTFLSGLKISLTVVWAVFALSLLNVLPQPYNTIALYFGAGLLLIHLLEYVALHFAFKKEISFVQTMLWGFGHWLPLLQRKQ